MTPTAIEVSDLNKDIISSFIPKKVRVLQNLNLTVSASEIYGLLGPNGAGKTTTVKIMLGLMRPTSGKVSVLGAPSGDAKALSRIGFLPENPYLYSHLTAFEFLDMVGLMFGMDGKSRRARIAYLFDIVSLKKTEAHKPLRKFSKGMLQRVAIAQSLMNDPDLLFWDEPMSGLDPIGRRDLRTILHQLKAEKKTIFLNSHLMPDVNEICDRIGIMNRGRLVAEEKISTISSGGNYKALEDYFLDAVSKAENARKDEHT